MEFNIKIQRAGSKPFADCSDHFLAADLGVILVPFIEEV
jgi:hypothetical protein